MGLPDVMQDDIAQGWGLGGCALRGAQLVGIPDYFVDNILLPLLRTNLEIILSHCLV